MTVEQPQRNNANSRSGQRSGLAMAIAGLANLAALALVICFRTECLESTAPAVALFPTLTIAPGASLIAMGLLFQKRGGVPGRTADHECQPDPSQRDASSNRNSPNDQRWLNLVAALVDFLEELENQRPCSTLSASDLAVHLDLRVQEILERSGVTVIANEATFDHNRHQAEAAAVHARTGALVAETTRCGLAVGRQVFRRARVRLASGGTQKQNDPSLDDTGRPS